MTIIFVIIAVLFALALIDALTEDKTKAAVQKRETEREMLYLSSK